VPQPRDGEALTEDEDPLEDGAIDLFDEQALVPGDGDEATGVTAEAEVELEALIDLDATGAPEAEPEAEAAEPEAENPEIPSETPKEV
jgi:hypothetical protein